MLIADPDAPALAGAGLFGLGSPLDRAAVVVIPAPFQATTSYRRGTRGGPRAVLEASSQVDLIDREFADALSAGVAMLPLEECPIEAWDLEVEVDSTAVIAAWAEGAPIDAAAIARVNAAGERVNAWVHAQAAMILDRGGIVGVLGGDHATPFGAIEAVARRHPGVGILHIDAHADLRCAYEGFTWSHASIFYNVLHRIPEVGQLTQVGIRDFGQSEQALILENPKVRTFFDADLAFELAGGATWRRLAERIIATLPSTVYVSFDIDGLEPSLCPSTGTPVPGGLLWHQAAVLLRLLSLSGRRIVGFDLCEVAPGPGTIDAIVGARTLHKLAGWAIASQGGIDGRGLAALG